MMAQRPRYSSKRASETKTRAKIEIRHFCVEISFVLDRHIIDIVASNKRQMPLYHTILPFFLRVPCCLRNSFSHRAHILGSARSTEKRICSSYISFLPKTCTALLGNIWAFYALVALTIFAIFPHCSGGEVCNMVAFVCYVVNGSLDMLRYSSVGLIWQSFYFALALGNIFLITSALAHTSSLYYCSSTLEVFFFRIRLSGADGQVCQRHGRSEHCHPPRASGISQANLNPQHQVRRKH